MAVLTKINEKSRMPSKICSLWRCEMIDEAAKMVEESARVAEEAAKKLRKARERRRFLTESKVKSIRRWETFKTALVASTTGVSSWTCGTWDRTENEKTLLGHCSRAVAQ